MKDFYITYGLLEQSPGGITSPGWLELKALFEKMSVLQKRELYDNNLELYRELTGINRWGREYD